MVPVTPRSVKRVLQRDGESSYFINNTHVRRRDVQDIFHRPRAWPACVRHHRAGEGFRRIHRGEAEELRGFSRKRRECPSTRSGGAKQHRSRNPRQPRPASPTSARNSGRRSSGWKSKARSPGGTTSFRPTGRTRCSMVCVQRADAEAQRSWRADIGAVVRTDRSKARCTAGDLGLLSSRSICDPSSWRMSARRARFVAVSRAMLGFRGLRSLYLDTPAASSRNTAIPRASPR